MKKAKALLVIVLITIAFTFVGCTGGSKTSTDANSLAADINNLASDANKVSAATDQLQVVAEQIMVVLKAAGAVDSNVAGTVEKVSAETDKVQTIFDNVVAALKANNIAASSDNIEAVLQLVLQINSATASVNPYSTYIYLIVTALLLLLGVWKTIQANAATTTAAKSTTALTQIVTGVEDFKETADVSAIESFKVAQAAIQSPETAGLVAQIKATTKETGTAA